MIQLDLEKHDFEIDDLVDLIKSNDNRLVALQVPEGLKMQALELIDQIKKINSVKLGLVANFEKGDEPASENYNEYLDKNDDDIPFVRVSALNALEAEDKGRDSEWGKGRWELMEAVDEYVPVPDRPKDQPFLMPVEDVFGIKGRGTVVTGRVQKGIVNVGDEVEVVGIKDTYTTTVTGVEMFHKTLATGEPGDAVGLLIRGVDREDIERGQVLAAPNSIKPNTEY